MVKIVWRKKALTELNNIYKHIKKTSPQSAMKVRSEILTAAGELELHPEIYPLDRFKKDNDGTFRAFEKYSYRITYRVLKTEISILRVRHTSREPFNY